MNVDSQTHINTFSNGMYRDCNVIYQPDGTYRYCRNFQIVSHDGTNVSLKDALGNRVNFTLPAPYNAVIASKQTEPTAIGMLSFPDKIIVFSTNYNGATGTPYGEIGYLDYLPYGESLEPTTNTVGGYNYTGYVPLYNHISLNFNKAYEINNEGFGYEENELVKRVYWTDNLNEPRVFNISDSIFTTYYASGSLVVGTQYMVLGGAVTHNAINYGPGLTAGNVFTAVNANWAQAADTPLVIKYYPYQLLSWTPSRSLGNIKFNSTGTGSVYCGSKMYFYRLGLSTSGYFTSWSYGSAPIPMGKANSPTALFNDAYHNWVGAGTTTTLVNSGKSMKIDISNIDTTFDIIQLACAEYDQTLEVPRLISIVQQATITGASMTLEHTGTVNLGTLTTADVTLFPANILTVKTMCTNKNYNLIANLTERTEFTTFDKSTVTISQSQYLMPVHPDFNSCPLGSFEYTMVSPTSLTPNSAGNPTTNNIIPGSRYLVENAPNAGNRVEYPVASGTYYYTGDVIVGVGTLANQANATFTGTATMSPCASVNKYTPLNFTTVSSQRNNYIKFANLDQAHWNYKNPAVVDLAKGYWSDEKYRFGILFYDLKGNPFYVRHLGDYTFQTAAAKGYVMNYIGWWNGAATVTSYHLRPSIAKISGIRIPASIVPLISGFSIVRAERDPTIITQGLVWQTTSNGGSPNVVRPSAGAKLLFDAQGVAVQSWSYIVPDNNVRIPFRKSIGVVGDTLKEAYWLQPCVWTAGTPQRSFSLVDQFLSKFMNPCQPDTASPRSTTISRWFDIAEGNYVTGFDAAGNEDFDNNNLTNSVFSVTDDLCTGGGGTTNMNGRQATGGSKIAMKTDSTWSHNDGSGVAPGYNYDGAGVLSIDNPNKIVMNYYVANANQYGGTGDNALANTLYISTGHFQQIDTTVIAETNDTNNPNSYAYLEFNNVEVGGGDCFTTLADYGYGLYDNISYPTSYSYGAYFPMECNSNYDLRRGRKVSNQEMHAGPDGVVWDLTGTTRLESYQYNQAYSSEGDLFQYPALPFNFVNAGKFKERIRFAGEKFIGEHIDSFRTFATNDYKDMNVVLGEINNIRPKGDYIYGWQNNGVFSSPIKQRQLVSGANGSETILGTGGVIDSYQTLSTFWGNQHKNGLTETKDGWIWFDMRNKDVCQLTYTGGIQDSIDVHLGMKSWFNEVFLQVDNSSIISIPLIDSPTFDITSDQPLMGVGICGVYDPKLQMSYLTFKFKDQTAENVIISKDFTIGFNHQINKFVGFYDMYPGIWHRHHQFVLSCNNPKNLTKFYGAGMASTDFVVGDVIADLNSEYICTTAGTVVAYVSPPSGALFTKINTTNQIWVQNQEVSYTTPVPGYQYNKQYGRVVDNEIIIVINPKTGRPFNVDAIAQADFNVNFTDLYYSNTNQTGADNSITTTNRDYQYVDGELWGSVPLANGAYGKSGRFTDVWLQLRAIKKNWSGSAPTTLTGSNKVLSYFKSLFRIKM